jgi:hypothetical protein
MFARARAQSDAIIDGHERNKPLPDNGAGHRAGQPIDETRGIDFVTRFLNGVDDGARY